MIRMTLTVAAVATGLLAIGGMTVADDKLEVKLTGTLMCGRCSLDATPKCSNVVQVKEGDTLVNYFLEDKGNRESYHRPVCGDGKVPGVTVTGTVTEKDGMKWVKVTKFELPNK